MLLFGRAARVSDSSWQDVAMAELNNRFPRERSSSESPDLGADRRRASCLSSIITCWSMPCRLLMPCVISWPIWEALWRGDTPAARRELAIMTTAAGALAGVGARAIVAGAYARVLYSTSWRSVSSGPQLPNEQDVPPRAAALRWFIEYFPAIC